MGFGVVILAIDSDIKLALAFVVVARSAAVVVKMIGNGIVGAVVGRHACVRNACVSAVIEVTFLLQKEDRIWCCCKLFVCGKHVFTVGFMVDFTFRTILTAESSLRYRFTYLSVIQRLVSGPVHCISIGPCKCLNKTIN